MSFFCPEGAVFFGDLVLLEWFWGWAAEDFALCVEPSVVAGTEELLFVCFPGDGASCVCAFAAEAGVCSVLVFSDVECGVELSGAFEFGGCEFGGEGCGVLEDEFAFFVLDFGGDGFEEECDAGECCDGCDGGCGDCDELVEGFSSVGLLLWHWFLGGAVCGVMCGLGGLCCGVRCCVFCFGACVWFFVYFCVRFGVWV